MYKICNKCQSQKPFEDFFKRSISSDGYQSQCKSCAKEYNTKYYEAKSKDILTQKQEYYTKNKEVISEQKSKYYIENKDKRQEYNSKYYELNRDELTLYQRKYGENNRDKINAISAKYRASKLKATPKWLTDFDLECMREMYTIARAFKLYTGQEYHVDHIIPLQGHNVCGLHVPWNLQVLAASENLSKSNKLQEINHGA